ncbi:CoB--CoM heterodisulfide reductase subunit C [Desulfocucumis palustris]|uniref:CoB--CoM heterodisulfide reductase subunit C n=1 Tax=Desulfocucumis palustris TaxID=1898651 RepID=A0A2L2XGH1_9FIRM|nr:4Fe-4S dicluster domain-containing protein [Desulfocucumis palustris]GBF35230.1 CoB--CoM heterodisulfide reductase subunit C [Desulfocucumis palustris]
METVSLNGLMESRDFTDRVCRESGQPAGNCYQCGKCTAGCPLAGTMDIPPNRVMRMVQLGLKDRLLNSQTIWICAFCSTCTVRCPRGLDPARVMESLRIMARREGTALKGRGKKVHIFNDNFLDSVKRFGRMFELGTMVGYNLKCGTPFKDGDTGLIMFLQGKLKFLPEKPREMDEISRIFEEVQRMEAEQK